MTNVKMMSEMIQRAKEIVGESVLKGNTSALFDNLTDEAKAKTSIAELSRRLASSEEQHGIFTRMGEATEPYPDPKHEGFWICEVFIYAKETEWFVRISMNSQFQVSDFSFHRKAFYSPPAYFDPHKIEVIQLCDCPVIKYMKPSKRKTLKLPIAVFIHSVVQVDYDGKIGLRYPFRDFDFLSQKKIGLIRSSYENYGEPDTVVSLAKRAIEKAMTIEENGGLFLIVHSFAALFLDRIIKLCPAVQGIVLINPAWEALPGSGLENMTAERTPKGIPILVIGSEFDQVMIKDHFDAWNQYLESSDSIWFENVDHFLMSTNRIPDTDTYMTTEAHVSDQALKRIARWIKSQLS